MCAIDCEYAPLCTSMKWTFIQQYEHRCVRSDILANSTVEECCTFTYESRSKHSVPYYWCWFSAAAASYRWRPPMAARPVLAAVAASLAIWRPTICVLPVRVAVWSAVAGQTVAAVAKWGAMWWRTTPWLGRLVCASGETSGLLCDGCDNGDGIKLWTWWWSDRCSVYSY